VASKQTSGAAALRYASALVDTAIQAKALEAIEKDLKDFEAMISASPDLQNLIRSPLFNRNQQRAAVTAIAEKAGFNSLTRNFLSLLAENRRMNIVSAVISAVKKAIQKHRGEVSASVKAAYPLTAEQTKALQEALGKATGRTVALNVDIDKTLIGGMIVTVGSKMIDDSVKRKLERLERAMKSGSNQNSTTKEEVI
jgi:F-type H+-transporting ATPase subunit delta